MGKTAEERAQDAWEAGISGWDELGRSFAEAMAQARVDAIEECARKLEDMYGNTSIAAYIAFRKNIDELIRQNGCECCCEHRWKEHDDECARCLACLIRALLDKGV